MRRSSKAATGGTLLLKTAWSEGMVVASHGRPLMSPPHRTITALIVLLEEGVGEVEVAMVDVAAEVDSVVFAACFGT